MSWSLSTQVVKKSKIEEALNTLAISEEIAPPALEQIQAAKRAALELLKTVPGPFVQVTFSGHANGVGWQKAEGYAADTIYVTVSQFIEPLG